MLAPHVLFVSLELTSKVLRVIANFLWQNIYGFHKSKAMSQ